MLVTRPGNAQFGGGSNGGDGPMQRYFNHMDYLPFRSASLAAAAAAAAANVPASVGGPSVTGGSTGNAAQSVLFQILIYIVSLINH